MSSQEVIVSISLGENTLRVGRLWFHLNKSRESASFEYDSQWLDHPERFALEPALQLTQGAFHTREDFSLFGAIGDSAPDRWGRVLMRRAHAAKAQDKTLKTLREADYLLGVNDFSRQGALRFSLPEKESEFLAPQQGITIPPLVMVSKLLGASERFLEDNAQAADLQLLLAPGSSLGGARPKASVRDTDGSLAIAKFPRKDDFCNVVAWEAVALTLAQKAAIPVPSFRLESILGKPVLILKRFDRKGLERIPFLSAMSMLGARDREQHSYLEIAYALAQHGASPDEDMKNVWRRIVFNVLISNTDDHLRNHGFLYERHRGWRLSPAYDLNPTPLEIKPHILSTAIDLEDTTASVELALSVAKEFRLSSKQAKTIFYEVHSAVSQWPSVAQQFGLSQAECQRMRSAFRV